MRFSNPPRNNFFRQSTPIASDVPATVKWFNPEKGFGFVAFEDGSPDAFLPASVVEAAGHDSLPDGATVVVDLVQGNKGPQVGALHSVDVSTAAARPRRNDRPGFGGGDRGGFGERAPRPRRDFDDGPTESVDGTVKWFNATKGFGFISPDSGGKDIFVHASALGRSGLHDLAENQRVRAQVRQGQKGPEAVSVETI
ncbi:cold-shock protein [Arenibaculum pallidiluteum]|uniref:cold-shock protein n=1 Tax=Arenibaculum pallidiluteum TaxID=2812559 RepID=UPI001A96B82B|nr:cold-shock protein [Arenibaculum pallidiluteum]